VWASRGGGGCICCENSVLRKVGKFGQEEKGKQLQARKGFGGRVSSEVQPMVGTLIKKQREEQRTRGKSEVKRIPIMVYLSMGVSQKEGEPTEGGLQKGGKMREAGGRPYVQLYFSSPLLEKGENHGGQGQQ